MVEPVIKPAVDYSLLFPEYPSNEALALLGNQPQLDKLRAFANDNSLNKGVKCKVNTLSNGVIGLMFEDLESSYKSWEDLVALYGADTTIGHTEVSTKSNRRLRQRANRIKGRKSSQPGTEIGAGVMEEEELDENSELGAEEKKESEIVSEDMPIGRTSPMRKTLPTTRVNRKDRRAHKKVEYESKKVYTYGDEVAGSNVESESGKRSLDKSAVSKVLKSLKTAIESNKVVNARAENTMRVPVSNGYCYQLLFRCVSTPDLGAYPKLSTVVSELRSRDITIVRDCRITRTGHGWHVTLAKNFMVIVDNMKDMDDLPIGGKYVSERRAMILPSPWYSMATMIVMTVLILLYIKYMLYYSVVGFGVIIMWLYEIIKYLFGALFLLYAFVGICFVIYVLQHRRDAGFELQQLPPLKSFRGNVRNLRQWYNISIHANGTDDVRGYTTQPDPFDALQFPWPMNPPKWGPMNGLYLANTYQVDNYNNIPFVRNRVAMGQGQARVDLVESINQHQDNPMLTPMVSNVSNFIYSLSDRIVKTRPYMSAPISVPKLPEATTAWLVKQVQNTSLTFNFDGMNKHPLSAAFRAICLDFIQSSVPSGMRVLVVGSALLPFPLDGYVHCMPNMESKDSYRHARKKAYITKMLANGKTIEYIVSRLELVLGRYDIMICSHSAYDIPMASLFKHALRIGAKTVYVTLMTNLSLYEDEYGVLPANQMRFEKYTIHGEKRVRMFHLNENGEAYDHNWDEYREWMSVRTVRVTKYLAYHGQVALDYPDNQVLVFNLAPLVVNFHSQIQIHNYHASSCVELLTTPEGIEGVHLPWQRIEAEVQLVPETLFANVMGNIAYNKAPKVENIRANILNVSNGWEKEHFHPYFDSYADNIEDVGKLAQSILDISIWNNWIRTTETGAIGFITGPWFKFSEIINSILPSGLDVLRARRTRNLFLRKLVSEKLIPAAAFDISKSVEELIPKLEAMEMIKMPTQYYMLERDNIYVRSRDRLIRDTNRKIGHARDWYVTLREVGCCIGLRLIWDIMGTRFAYWLAYRWYAGEDVNTAEEKTNELIDAARRKRAERKEDEAQAALARLQPRKVGDVMVGKSYNQVEMMSPGDDLESANARRFISGGNVDTPSNRAGSPNRLRVGDSKRTGIGMSALANRDQSFLIENMTPEAKRELRDIENELGTSVPSAPSASRSSSGFAGLEPVELSDIRRTKSPKPKVSIINTSDDYAPLSDVKEDGEDEKWPAEDEVKSPSAETSIRIEEVDGNAANLLMENDENIAEQEDLMRSLFENMGSVVKYDKDFPIEEPNLALRHDGLLGEASNDQSFGILYNVPKSYAAQGRFGRVNRPRLDDFISCVVVNPDRVYTHINNNNMNTLTLIDNMIWNLPIILIKGRTFTYCSDLSTIRNQDVIIIEYTNGKFARMPALDEKQDGDTFCKGKGLIRVGYQSLYEFDIVSDYITGSAPEGFCFYKCILGSNYMHAVGQNDTFCTPEKIVELCWKRRVAIIRDGSVYLPPHSYLNEITQYIYAYNGHCYTMDLIPENIIGNLAFDHICNWKWPLNGIMERENILTFVELEIMKYLPENVALEFSSLSGLTVGQIIRENPIDIPTPSERRFAVAETLMYNIFLERTLLRKFDIITVNNSIQPDKSLTGHYIYDTLSNKFISNKPDSIMNYCWDGEEFVEAVYDTISKVYKITTNKRFAIFSDDLQFLRERKLIDNLMNNINEIMNYNYDDINITLVNGVPGCGKTYEINYRHMKNKDIVLTATKEAMNDYRKLPNRDPKYYRTYDSVLLNPVVDSPTVYADEGLMVHGGDLLLCCWKCKASEVFIFGDSFQIPFINRAIGFVMRYNVLKLDNIEIRDVTYRSPKNMMPILRQFYPSISTKSETEGSIRIIKTKAPTLTDYNMVMTFTQYEKSEIKKLTKCSVHTIHEVQGKAFDHVALVRINPQANAIYDSQPHIIVGISRHRKSIDYYTVDDTDTISKLLRGNVINKVELRNKLESNLRPIRVNKCHSPILIDRQITLKFSDRKNTNFAQWVIEKVGYTGSYMVEHTVPTWEVIEPEDTGDSLDVPIEDVQLILNTIYDERDPIAQEKLNSINVFPLPDDFIIRLDKLLSAKESQEVYLNPILKTPMPTRSKGSLIDVVEAIQKRNLNPPILHFTRNPDLVNEIVDRFFDIYIDSDKLNIAKKLHDYNNGIYFETWLARRTGTQMAILNGYEMKDYNPSTYNSHLKPELKPSFDNSHNQVKSAGQIVTAHNPVITGTLSGIMGCFTIILKSSLKDNWLINDGYNNKEISGFMTQLLSEHEDFIPQEIDFSKFDKSQEQLILQCNCEILRRLGVPENYVKYWYDCHVTNTLVFHKLGIKVKTMFQRRSGDILTFLLNTITSMFVLSYTHEYESAIGGIFGGDDSFIALKPTMKLFDQSRHIAAIFNLSAKLEYFPKAMYFSSKFLIQVQNQWLFLPDPLKVIFKLGRDDMFCKEHIELYYISFCDNLKWYKNQFIREKLIETTYERYKINFKRQSDLSCIVYFISSLINDKRKFLNLYSGPFWIWWRRMPKSMIESFERFSSFIETELW